MHKQPPPNYTSSTGLGEEHDHGSFMGQQHGVLSPLLQGGGQAPLAGAAAFPRPGSAPSDSSFGFPGSGDGGRGGYPADFSYGVDVKSSSVSVQMAFVRKVYSILCLQLFASALVGALMLASTTFQIWAWNNSWALIVSMVMTFVSLGLLYWKRHSVPTNYGLLAMFTFFESYMVGNSIVFFDSKVVLQAVIITAGVVIGLTLFTLQTKWDFSGMGPWLTGCLLALILVSFVQIFFPFNRMLDLFIAIGTALVFIGFILYDTQNLFKMSPDEYIAASVTLYLDVLNLFLAILRILRYLNDDR